MELFTQHLAHSECSVYARKFAEWRSEKSRFEQFRQRQVEHSSMLRITGLDYTGWGPGLELGNGEGQDPAPIPRVNLVRAPGSNCDVLANVKLAALRKLEIADSMRKKEYRNI